MFSITLGISIVEVLPDKPNVSISQEKFVLKLKIINYVPFYEAKNFQSIGIMVLGTKLVSCICFGRTHTYVAAYH